MAEKNADLLAHCLEAIEQGDMTLEEVLERYPQQRMELEPLLKAAIRMRKAPPVNPRPEFRRIARTRLLERLSPRQPVTFWDRVRLKWRSRTYIFQRRFAMTWVLILTMLTALVGGGGVAYASEDALPGDVLYPVKTGIEDVRLTIANEEGDVGLYTRFAQKRVEEIQDLVEAGRHADIPLAVDRFDNQVEQAARALASMGAEDSARAEALATLLNEALSVHTQVLTTVLEQVPEQAKPSIEHALEVSTTGQRVTEQLLQGEIPFGPPDEADQPEEAGPPEDAGPPDEVGPPEDAGPPDEVGPPEDADPTDEAGLPDDAGPSEGAGPP